MTNRALRLGEIATMNDQAEQLHFALSALDTAAHAIHQVMDIVPEAGLEQVVEHLRTVVAQIDARLHG